jgi:toxin ParE1/3/4
MPEAPARRVEWTRAAAGDLEAIATYVAVDSPENARRLIGRLRRRAATLEATAERGRLVPELSRFGIRTFRELRVQPYRLIYRIEEHRVLVLALFDARRDLDEVLLERLVRPD